MPKPAALRRRCRSLTLGSGLAASSVLAPGAWAQTAIDAPISLGDVPVSLGEASVSGAPALSAPPAPGTAAYSAPSRAPLDASQPTSLVGPRFHRPQRDPDAELRQHHPLHAERAERRAGRPRAAAELYQTKLDFRLNVNNIFDNTSRTFLNQLAADGKTGLYYVNAGRSVFVSVAASL